MQIVCRTAYGAVFLTFCMKRLLFFLTILPFLTLSAKAQDQFFQLPIVPDSIVTLTNRTNYLITHYWDFCDLNKSFSTPKKMAEAFESYLDLMPYATAEEAHASVSKFLKAINKKPENVLFIGRLAEANLYADTSEMLSDELYLPFAEAIANHKKIRKEDKAHFERQARILRNCQVGLESPDFEYTSRDGSLKNFTTNVSDVVVLFFFEPGSAETTLARVRLDADINAQRLIDNGILKIVAISPSVADGEWRDAVSSFPSHWEVGATEAVNNLYDIRLTPSFFIMDGSHKLYGKNAPIESVLSVCMQLAARLPKTTPADTTVTSDSTPASDSETK